MEPPWDGGMKVCSNGLGRMTKMAAMPIYSKNLKKIIFSGTERLMTLKVGMQHWVLEYYMYQIISDEDPGMTLTYFTARSNLVPYAFIQVKQWIFSETIVVYYIKVGRCSQLNEYMKLYEYQSQGHSLTLVQITQIQYF